MNPHEQNVAIAKFLGLDIDHVKVKPAPGSLRAWHYYRGVNLPKDSYAVKHGESCTNPAWIPKYTEDLNACHEVEKKLFKLNLYQDYWPMLESVVGEPPGIGRATGHAMHATAPQRCKTILKLINKWTGE